MRKVSALILLAVCINLNAQKGKYLMCRWLKSAGDEVKIADADYTLFKKGKLWYCFSNDNENLYIDVRIDDSGVQTKVLNEGMIVWINTDGKSLKSTGIRFPLGARTMRGQRNAIVSGSLLSMANTLELLGFSDKPVSLPSDNTDNIRGSVKYNSEGSLLYTMLVPLEKLSFREDIKSSGILPFTIGIEYGMTEITGRPAGGGMTSMPSGGGRGGGGGRPGGGGMPGGGSAPRGAPAPSAAQPVIQWVKNIKLATE